MDAVDQQVCAAAACQRGPGRYFLGTAATFASDSCYESDVDKTILAGLPAKEAAKVKAGGSNSIATEK